MALSNLFSKFSKKISPTEQNYISLTLIPNKIIATVWTFRDQKIEIIGSSQKTFHDKNAIIHEAAVAIDKAAQNATNDVEKLVFGLDASWLENGQLKVDSAKLLKEMAKDLDLDPQAFIPLSAAADHFLKLEKPDVNRAILLGVFDNLTEISITHNHKVDKTKVFSQKLELKDIQEAISSLDESDQKATTIAVYGSQIHDFSIKLNKKDHYFNNYQIVQMTEEELTKAVCLAQAADVLGHEPQDITNASPHQVTIPDQPTDKSAPIDSTLGFIADMDVLQSKEDEPAQEAETESNEEITPIEEAENIITPPLEQPQETIVPADQKLYGKSKKSLTSFYSLNWLFSLINKAPSPKVAVIILIGVILLAVALTFVAKKSLTSANVTIKINGKELENDFKVEAYTSQVPQDSFTASQLTASQEGNSKAVATGKKKVGQYAKGQVQVLNWTTSQITLQKDIALITKSGIKFKLDSAVDVASRSASTPGQSDAPLVAVDFGLTGNISAGNDFNFQKYDELLYSARNDQPFSGGDEKEITVVSQDDLLKLEKLLTDSLTQKAKDDLKLKSEGRTLSDDAIIVKITKKQFDKTADEEAVAVNLNMIVEVSALVFTDSDLKNFLAQKFAGSTQAGYELKGENINIDDISSKRQKDKLIITGHFKARLLPQIVVADLVSSIAGKSTKDAREIIRKIPDVSDVTFSFTPNIPFITSLPANKSKIKIKLEAI